MDLNDLYQISKSIICSLVMRVKIHTSEQSDKTPIKIRTLNNRSTWKVISLLVKNAKEPFYLKDMKSYLI